MPDYAGKEEGMAMAEAGASEAWKAAASSAIAEAAKSYRKFSSDEVWVILHSKGISAPTEPRAMGPMMRNASRSGLISKTGYSKISDQEHNHARPVAVWKSQVFVEKKVPFFQRVKNWFGQTVALCMGGVRG
jgi:hypothetical protein